MSRLESNPEPSFQITKEKETASPVGLFAVPLNLRKQAIEEFDREFRLEDSRQQAPQYAEYLSNARLLFKQKEYLVAREMYRTVLKLDPENEAAIRGLSECAKATFEHEEALRVLKRLVQSKGSAIHYKLLGDQLYDMNYNEDAIEAYMRAQSFDDLEAEEHFETLKNCGNILLRMGDANSAEEYYNKAYTLFPDSDILLVNYGSLALYRGEYDKALNRFREAVSQNDQNDKAWVGLAMIHREYGDSELAWANVEKALDINPSNESAAKLIADWAMKDNEIEKAIHRLANYFRFNPSDAIICMWLAKFYYFSGRLESAILHAESALRLDPEVEGGLEVLTIVKSEMRNRGVKA